MNESVVGTIDKVDLVGPTGNGWTKYDVTISGVGGYIELTKYPSSYAEIIGETGEWEFTRKTFKGNEEKLLGFLKRKPTVRIKTAYTGVNRGYNTPKAPIGMIDADKQIIGLLREILEAIRETKQYDQ